MALVQKFRCLDCLDTFEVLVHNGQAVYMTDDEVCAEAEVKCRACASQRIDGVVGTALRPETVEYDNSYPRFDRGLDCMLESEAHRRRICKERGLVPMDHVPQDLPTGYKTALRERNRKADEGEAFIRRLDDDPAFVATRLARDRGEMLDWRKGHTQREVDEFNRKKGAR